MAQADHFKISRKDLREPDAVQTFGVQSVEWFRANQSAVVGALSAALAVGALLVGYSWYTQRQATTAAVRFQSAASLFDTKKFAEAANEFAAVSAEYGRTPSGRLAGLYRAHALAQQPDPAAAATAYGEYLASGPQTDYLRQEALLGLARAQEASSGQAAALDSYRQAAEIAGPFRTQARLGLARLEDAAGNADKARAIYAELLDDVTLDADTRQTIAAKLPPDARKKADAKAAAAIAPDATAETGAD
jgi:predicted negative regulator of RcsB-dependent stress response